MAQKHILIVCGEVSGDLHAANLARNILKLNPNIMISAVGGNLLRQAGARIFYDIKSISAIGLFDVLKKLPKFFALKKLILQKIRTEKPDCLILVDFSGFNLRLAKEINKKIPVIYYIAPQVWASRQGRVKAIKKYTDKAIVLFKFEEGFYKKYGINANFTGHPLLDIVRPSMSREEFLARFNLSPSKTTIALLPGSRDSEIANILPVMLKASAVINKKLGNAQFVIAKPPQRSWGLYNKSIIGTDIDFKIIEGQTYDCLSASDFALVASGTATLETAILGTPFLLIYKMSLLNYFLYCPQVKIPFIGMPNIIAAREVVPELIQFNATAKNISREALKIINNPSELERIRNDFREIKKALGEPGASARAAKIVVDFLNQSNN